MRIPGKSKTPRNPITAGLSSLNLFPYSYPFIPAPVSPAACGNFRFLRRSFFCLRLNDIFVLGNVTYRPARINRTVFRNHREIEVLSHGQTVYQGEQEHLLHQPRGSRTHQGSRRRPHARHGSRPHREDRIREGLPPPGRCHGNG